MERPFAEKNPNEILIFFCQHFEMCRQQGTERCGTGDPRSE